MTKLRSDRTQLYLGIFQHNDFDLKDMSTAVLFPTEICAPPVSRSGFLWRDSGNFGTNKENLILLKPAPALCEANMVEIHLGTQLYLGSSSTLYLCPSDMLFGRNPTANLCIASPPSGQC